MPIDGTLEWSEVIAVLVDGSSYSSSHKGILSRSIRFAVLCSKDSPTQPTCRLRSLSWPSMGDDIAVWSACFRAVPQQVGPRPKAVDQGRDALVTHVMLYAPVAPQAR